MFEASYLNRVLFDHGNFVELINGELNFQMGYDYKHLEIIIKSIKESFKELFHKLKYIFIVV